MGDRHTDAVHPDLRTLLAGDGVIPPSGIAAARDQRRAAALDRSGPAAEGRAVSNFDVPGVHLRRYDPLDRIAGGALVLIPGGGWVWGGLDEVDALARSICIATGRRTVSMQYRLAPEHRSPAALDDVCTAIAWLHDHAGPLEIDPSHLVLVGLSAGGQLALAAAARMRGTQRAVAAQVLVYPMLDPTVGAQFGPSVRQEGNRSCLVVVAHDRAPQ